MQFQSSEYEIHDCSCQLRYMRHVLHQPQMQAGRAMCPCGQMLGEWDGKFQLFFEPEELGYGN